MGGVRSDESAWCQILYYSSLSSSTAAELAAQHQGEAQGSNLPSLSAVWNWASYLISVCLTLQLGMIIVFIFRGSLLLLNGLKHLKMCLVTLFLAGVWHVVLVPMMCGGRGKGFWPRWASGLWCGWFPVGGSILKSRDTGEKKNVPGIQ